jgi:hypothetical protein
VDFSFSMDWGPNSNSGPSCLTRGPAEPANARKAKAYKALGGCHSHLYDARKSFQHA